MERLAQPGGRFGWWMQHRQVLRYAGIGFAGLIVLVVLAQVLYPSGRTLPGVKVANQTVGNKSLKAAQAVLDDHYKKAGITIATEDKTFTRSLEVVGVTTETKTTVQTAANYPMWQRLIPFSSIFIMQNRDVSMETSFDDDRLKYFAQEVNKDGFVPAVNATVTVKGSRVELVSSKPSKEYSVTVVEQAVRRATFTPQTTVRVVAKKKEAARTDNEVKSLLKDAQKAVDTPLNLTLVGERILVDKATIASWLDFPEDPATMKLRLALKQEMVTKYLEGIQKKIYRAPGTTTVRLVDGIEVDRTVGAAGRGVDTSKTITLINEVLHKGNHVTVDVPIAQLAPRVVYTRQYSNSDAGLTALLNDLSAKGFGISVREAGGVMRRASINGDKSFVAASTYKLFVAYAVFKEIEAGRMSWSESIGGRSAEDCFNRMIVNSDNPCAKAFGDRIGWQNVENQMRGLGLGATELSPSITTTANDLSTFLLKLQSGSLLNAPDTARLLDLMKRQIYRAGIPAGTGAATANKPGFIDGYIHDAGIVYGAKGPYVLVIMTSGSSWGSIADAARQINAYLNG